MWTGLIHVFIAPTTWEKLQKIVQKWRKHLVIKDMLSVLLNKFIHYWWCWLIKKTIKNAYNETTSDYIKKIKYILHRNTVSTYIYFRCENSIYTYMTMNPLGFFECRSIKDFYWKPTIWFTSLDLKRDENLSMDCILTLKVGLRVVLLSTASR